MIFNLSLFAQDFIGQPVEYQNRAKLDALFTDYEIVQLDIKSMQTSLNTRASVKNMRITTPKQDWDLVLFEFDIFKEHYFLTKATDEGKQKLPRNKNLRTFKANLKIQEVACLV